MRKYVKKELSDIIKQLNIVNDIIQKKLEMMDAAELVQLLTQCQESAITVGNRIDQDAGENTETVKLLEEYCEEIYQLSTVSEDVREAKKHLKRITDCLNKIIHSIKYDLPDSKKEVVFLPYKASMWDSLESVWMAARDDESCNAYVIPIPYYDKNPDGTFKEVHYEGDLYPDYVPITCYDDYDFEKRHPDVIYIHNPYDEWNHVTSVHPFFYSKNLKNFTDELVYIPYFVLAEVDPDNEEEVKSIEHFCTVPGVLHADKVIVQSENMRKAYIKNLKKWLNREQMQEFHIEEKILGLGSPKMDKVINTTRESVQIPEEWQKLICKTDGSRKKIIFYNTSVNALLQYSEQMLLKIKDVLRIFKENQDKVTLLWRPHPLIKATLESMRPELINEYEEIVREYREEGWGIYDDTPDLDRAIAISDGYYGDGSSVVQLCQTVGMPVMIQNVKIVGNNFEE